MKITVSFDIAEEERLIISQYFGEGDKPVSRRRMKEWAYALIVATLEDLVDTKEDNDE